MSAVPPARLQSIRPARYYGGPTVLPAVIYSQAVEGSPMLHHPVSCDCPSCRHVPSRVFSPTSGTTTEAEGRLMRGDATDVALHGHPSRLSLRWVTAGEYTYRVDNQRYRLKPGAVLVLDDGRTYDSASPSGVPISSFSLSFSRNLTSEVLDATIRSDAALLDSPEPRLDRGGIEFLTHARPVDAELRPLLVEWVALTERGRFSDLGMRELLRRTLARLIVNENKARAELRALPALKAATRIELYRRLNVARALLHAHPELDINLDRLAGEACLSPFHFLRSFKQAFGKTPHQYLLDLRLEKARRLLAARRASLVAVALECGFNDPSTFSKAFKKKFGVPPGRVGATN